MAEELHLPISIERCELSAVLISDFVVSFLIYLIRIGIPPLIPTLVTAKLLWLDLRFLNNLRHAILKGSNDWRNIPFLYDRLSCRLLP
ncbi:MAG: hypothetical protein NC485_06475 [Ruminococcus flavefaciens]|nr:hypothetical protein [Ruminococcus flavefaciens]MCM1060462.1 hypothetical protein [Eubacterium sp.]